MAHPRPLTQCPPAQLDWSRPSTPAATDFGDIYFSTDGGLDETRTVFLGAAAYLKIGKRHLVSPSQNSDLAPD